MKRPYCRSRKLCLKTILLSDWRTISMSNPARHYYSSTEKDIIRTYFDLPLLLRRRQRKGSKLKYFGLPGPECLDIEEWRTLLCDVVAVEVCPANVHTIRDRLDIEFSEIRSTVHLGDVDGVIRQNRGSADSKKHNIQRDPVGRDYEFSVEANVWKFDVVNLDYFGNLLPPIQNRRGRNPDRRRSEALTQLFERNRIDAWQTWILLLTVGGGPYGRRAIELLSNYLEEAKEESDQRITSAIDLLLLSTGNKRIDTAKLVHGAVANLLSAPASAANVDVVPRGTVSYLGANNQPMIHLAFEFRKSDNMLNNPHKLPLFEAPILRVNQTFTGPWFELLSDQCPGTTPSHVRSCLNFLKPESIELILADHTKALGRPNHRE